MDTLYSKINTRSAVLNHSDTEESKDSLHVFYQRHKREFEYAFNLHTPYLRHFHVVQNEFALDKENNKAPYAEGELKDILNQIGNTITLLIGESGSGKTESLKYAFDYSANSPEIIDNNSTIVLPVNYCGQQTEVFWDYKYRNRLTSSFTESGNTETISGYLVYRDIARAMAAACEKIEREFFPNSFDSKFTEKLWKHLYNTNLKTIQLIPWEHNNSVQEMLNIIEESSPYVYYTALLSLLLSSDSVPITRMIIVVDGIDTYSDSERDTIISGYIDLFNFIDNIQPQNPDNISFINLVISMWPTTYHDIYFKRWFAPCRISPTIYQENRIELNDYFNMIFDRIPSRYKENKNLQWDDVHNVINELCTKYDHKFSKLIMGLSNNNLRDAIKMCQYILSDPVWMTKYPRQSLDTKSYYMNNISILRAIGCGKDRVYLGDGNKTIPNILYNRIDEEGNLEDNSIISLYIIKYLLTKNTVAARAWPNKMTTRSIVSALTDTFGKNIEGVPNFEKRIERTLEQLCRDEIIIKTQSALYLSSKGKTIFNSLKKDSVLYEMYREDFLQEVSDDDKLRFLSSMDMMEAGNQHLIFSELYLLQKEQFERVEKHMIIAAKKKNSWNRYISLFGEEPMIMHLVTGVNSSVEFSGKSGDETVITSRRLLMDSITSL